MTKIMLLVSLILASQGAIAGTPHYNCSYDDIMNIASYSEGASLLSERQLNSAEQAKMEEAFDDEYNCNEGVELTGAVKTIDGADYTAICWADSLGSNRVSLEMDCIQK